MAPFSSMMETMTTTTTTTSVSTAANTPCIHPADSMSKLLVRKNPTTTATTTPKRKNAKATITRKKRLSEEGRGVWTPIEHQKFLEGLKMYPKGPWKLVSAYVGTRSARQTMTHAQKYRQKLARRMRGLRTRRKSQHDHPIAPKLLSMDEYFSSSASSTCGSEDSESMLAELELELAEYEHLLSTPLGKEDEKKSAKSCEEELRAESPCDPCDIDDIPCFEDCLDYLIQLVADEESLPVEVAL